MLMKAVILYRAKSEFASSVDEYVREFGRETGKGIALVDQDSRQGIEIARLFDIMQFPAIVVFRDDGSFIQAWTEREKWPTISELSYYT